MRVAVLADIHGNSWALGRVLRDVERRRVDRLLDLGDSLYGPLDPRGTFRLIRSSGLTSLAGNEDRLIVERGGAGPTLRFVREELDEEAAAWLRSLPRTRILDGVAFMCHGTPRSDTTYLLERVRDGGLSVKTPGLIEALLRGVGPRLVFCGHSHVPRLIETPHRLVLNPGSVGCPAYDDDRPSYHRVENHSGLAHYAVVEIDGGAAMVERISLPYASAAAAERASRNGRPDWAHWLLSGRVSGARSGRRAA